MKVITTNNEEVELISSCCGAKMVVESGKEDLGHRGVTCFYVCTKCHKPCNFKEGIKRYDRENL